MTATDPIRRMRRRLALMWAAGIPVIMIAATWAFVWPNKIELPQLDVEAVLKSAVTDSTAPDSPKRAGVDAQVFDVRLWNPPPDALTEAEPEERPTPPTPPPLRVIGIINDAGILRAALYDLEQDKLLIVQNGEKVRDCVVERIEPATVVLQQGDHSHELHLKEDQS